MLCVNFHPPLAPLFGHGAGSGSVWARQPIRCSRCARAAARDEADENAVPRRRRRELPELTDEPAPQLMRTQAAARTNTERAMPGLAEN